MKLNNKEEDNNNMKEVNLNKENYYKKLQINNKKEEWYYNNYKDKNNKCKHQDKIMKEKFKIENSKAEKIYKFLRKPIDYIEKIFHDYL